MELLPRQVEKLLNGNYEFSLLSLSLLITRLKNLYANDPSPQILCKCGGELSTFVKKFGRIMGNDYAIIKDLGDDR